MAAATNRPQDTRNILSHDMAPVDPPSASIATCNPIYEPSTGQPRRGFAKTNHIAVGLDGSLGMMTEPIKTGLSDHLKDAPSGRLQKPKPQRETAAVSNEFYAGKHSTPLVRTNAAGISLMFDNTDTAQQRLKDQKQREKEYSDANWQAIQEHRQAAAQAKRQKEPPISHDPWSTGSVGLIPANDRVPRQAIASNGRMFNQTSPTQSKAYVDVAFGKGGAGAPRRRSNGQVKTSREGVFAKNKPFDEGPADSYVAIHLGKNKPVRTNSGGVNARRKHMQQDPHFDPYMDKFMGKPQGNRTESGRVKTHRAKTVASFDTSGKGSNDFFGPRFGTKPKASGHRTFDSQLSKEATAQPATFLERMKGKTSPRQHVSVERDEEFAVCVARAQRSKTLPPRAPPKVHVVHSGDGPGVAHEV
eukprot:m.87721 g.87721  ORF g.87721 m.87721 type:complete len:416 (+) comp14792_c0_seq5:145-1392(+)